MARRYNYQLIAPMDAAPSLARAVFQRVDWRNPRRAAALLQAHPVRYLELFSDRAFEIPPRATRTRDACLSMLFPLDAELEAYGPVRYVDDMASIGCIWSTIVTGQRFAMFTATAATSHMSDLFRESPSVRTVFTEIASESGCRVALFDDEQPEVIVFWPEGPRRIWIDHPWNDYFDFEVDGYCAAAIQAAR